MSNTATVKRVKRSFTDEQRKEILELIDNRETGTNLTDAIKDAGISAPLYYLWKEKFEGKSSKKSKSEKSSKSSVVVMKSESEDDSSMESDEDSTEVSDESSLEEVLAD